MRRNRVPRTLLSRLHSELLQHRHSPRPLEADRPPRRHPTQCEPLARVLLGRQSGSPAPLRRPAPGGVPSFLGVRVQRGSERASLPAAAPDVLSVLLTQREARARDIDNSKRKSRHLVAQRDIPVIL